MASFAKLPPMVGKRLQLPARRHFGIRFNGQPQRRLTDKVRVAFHAACDEGAVEIAERLLIQLEQLIHSPSQLPIGFDRRRPERLTAPAERLANLLLWQIEGTEF
jgi:hypothetical protein